MSKTLMEQFNTVCKKCGAGKLGWKQVSGRWRLITSELDEKGNYKFHSCPPRASKMNSIDDINYQIKDLNELLSDKIISVGDLDMVELKKLKKHIKNCEMP